MYINENIRSENGLTATTISASTYLNFPFKYEDITSEFVSFLPFTYSLQNQAVTINIMYWIPVYIERNLNIISVSIFIGTLSAGAAVVGLYDSDAVGAPNNLLFQTTAFNNGVTSTQTYTLPTPQSINAGLYYIGFNSSSTANYRSVAATSYVNISSLANANVAPYSRISKTFNYTGTLPPTFAGVGGAASKGAVVNPHILFGISY